MEKRLASRGAMVGLQQQSSSSSLGGQGLRAVGQGGATVGLQQQQQQQQQPFGSGP